MKINNINFVSQYPENYDFLTQEEKDTILNYMNGTQNLAERYYERHNHEDTEENNKWIRMFNHVMTLQTGAKNAFSILGIKVEYNWPTQYHKWILATKEDYDKWLQAKVHPYPDQCPVQDQDLDSELLSYMNV